MSDIDKFILAYEADEQSKEMFFSLYYIPPTYHEEEPS